LVCLIPQVQQSQKFLLLLLQVKELLQASGAVSDPTGSAITEVLAAAAAAGEGAAAGQPLATAPRWCV
jgi:hypothetical protein